jgi:serine/threonine protein kinase
LGDGSSLSDYKEIRVYILSELCEINLQSFVHRRSTERKERSLQPLETLHNYQMALEMMEGLNYLHSKRIIHRDIKLHNVMIGSDGRCRLIDFGLAKRVKYWKTSIEDQHYKTMEKEGEDDEKFSSSIGTKLFSSPEQATS